MAVSDYQRIAHLLRRAGFGATPAEMDVYLQLGFEGTVETLLDPSAEETGDIELPLDGVNPRALRTGLLPARWLYRMANTSRPLVEKMAFFWHGHFATSIDKVKNTTIMWQQYEFLRDNGLGTFHDLALGISMDPAMIVWLDNVRSRKEAPNENYARELLELFTLGIGNYTEDDVKAAAAAFTGWSLVLKIGAELGDDNLVLDMLRANEELTEEMRRELQMARRTADADFLFRASWHDNGEKRFLGEVGPLDGDDIVRVITEQQANADFITRKLFSFFVWDNPDSQTLEPFVAVYQNTGGDIRETMRAILLSDAFSSDEAYRAKIKSPVELVVGLIKDFGMTTFDFRFIDSLQMQGQVPFTPPHVGGWPSGTAWIGPSTLLERFNLPYRLINGSEGSRQQSAISPGEWGTRLGIDSAMSPEDVVDSLVQRFLVGDAQTYERETLLTYAQSAGLTGSSIVDNATPESQAAMAGLVRLVTSVPTYQLN